MKHEPFDPTLLTVVAVHPSVGRLQFTHVRQDRRDYYGLTHNGKRGGMLTDVTHARETVAYWRDRGWIVAVKAEWDAAAEDDQKEES